MGLTYSKKSNVACNASKSNTIDETNDEHNQKDKEIRRKFKKNSFVGYIRYIVPISRKESGKNLTKKKFTCVLPVENCKYEISDVMEVTEKNSKQLEFKRSMLTVIDDKFDKPMNAKLNAIRRAFGF